MRRTTVTVWHSAVGSAAVFGVGLLLGLGMFSGCRGGGKPAEEKSAAAKADHQTKSLEGKTAPAEPVRRGQPTATKQGRFPRAVWTDRSGQKWWHKHPYDVWYGDALRVAQDTRSVGTNVAANTKTGGQNPGKTNPPSKVTGKTPPAKTSGDDWKSIAPAPVLEAEVKRIRNFLLQKMRSPSVYNGNYKTIQYLGSTLAAIAQVVALHDEDISWKADALYVRDLGQKISEEASGLGAKKFKGTKLPVEQFIDILNRNKPAGLAEPDKSATFFDVADRGGLMKRMEEAYNWLEKEVTTEERFKMQADKIKHEATILGLLVKIIGDASYDSADDPDYKGHVEASVQAAQKILSAVQTGDFMTYRKALNTINNRCTQCHTGFRE